MDLCRARLAGICAVGVFLGPGGTGSGDLICPANVRATVLANGVVGMTPGPGGSESDNPLDLQRPRDVARPEFNAIRRVLSAKLHSHHGKKAA